MKHFVLLFNLKFKIYSHVQRKVVLWWACMPFLKKLYSWKKGFFVGYKNRAVNTQNIFWSSSSLKNKRRVNKKDVLKIEEKHKIEILFCYSLVILLSLEWGKIDTSEMLYWRGKLSSSFKLFVESTDFQNVFSDHHHLPPPLIQLQFTFGRVKLKQKINKFSVWKWPVLHTRDKELSPLGKSSLLFGDMMCMK